MTRKSRNNTHASSSHSSHAPLSRILMRRTRRREPRNVLAGRLLLFASIGRRSRPQAPASARRLFSEWSWTPPQWMALQLQQSLSDDARLQAADLQLLA